MNMDQLITKETARLARKVHFDYPGDRFVDGDDTLHMVEIHHDITNMELPSDSAIISTQTSLHKYLMKMYRIYVHVKCNAGGWLWELERTDGTSCDCWSKESGPNGCGQWEEYEDALEDGLRAACEWVMKQKWFNR
mgnify:CR=1 FL=1